jgi:SAM-dependent methyltransferase
VEPEEYRRTADAEDHHFWFRELRWIWQGLLGRPAPGETWRILDAGCGTGANMRAIESRHTVIGIDRSRLALDIACTKTKSPLACASILALPFRPGSFDAAISTDVIYHRDVGDDVAALREIRRVLKPGGRLVVNVPAFDSLRSAHDRAVHTARRYRRGMLRERLGAAGFHPVRTVYWNSILLLPAIAARLIRRGGEGSDIHTPPEPVNAMLSAVGRVDATLALAGLFPAGLSIAAFARRAD